MLTGVTSSRWLQPWLYRTAVCPWTVSCSSPRPALCGVNQVPPLFLPKQCMLRMMCMWLNLLARNALLMHLQQSKRDLLPSLRLGKTHLCSLRAQCCLAPGAGHYAAANCVLDGLSARRQDCGLPSTALQFGPFAETGMAAQHAQQLAALGLNALKPRQASLSSFADQTAEMPHYDC